MPGAASAPAMPARMMRRPSRVFVLVIFVSSFHTNIGLAHHISPTGDFGAHESRKAFRA
jgi:hypothetical protein